jgi:hypothetical protein
LERAVVIEPNTSCLEDRHAAHYATPALEDKMQFREHRGGLAESMATAFEFHTLEQLLRHIGAVRPDIVVSGSIVTAKPYGGDDDCIGWKNVHIVTADKGGVIGFIDGPLPAPAPF